MAVIRSAVFTITWTTQYPDLLADGALGGLTTRSRHEQVYRSYRPELIMPWEPDAEPATWSRFWSAYLGKPGVMRKPNADIVFQRVVPFRLGELPSLHGPEGTTATARVLLYPAAIAVTLTVRVAGSWLVTDLADALSRLRAAAVWGIDAPGQLTLRAIATRLRDAAAPRLTTDGRVVEAGPTSAHTVAAPLTATDGTPDDLTPPSDGVGPCIAGLASLGPPGSFDADRFLASNTDTNLAGRLYAHGSGLTIWSPRQLFDQPGPDRLLCLVRNQTDLSVQVEALRGMAQWAADQLAEGPPPPVEIHPLLRATAARLRALREGRRDRTYRSKVAALRIDPLADALATLDVL
ncbi:hypothetical protein [Actinokineospora terrae]|uniref:Uncharacterized protein n=1 Tax=Actinokineospora terrae TaxID=155974 RepID=A0A1H9X9P1_9PSEU|nr:hypothetical protein [Actinokineospora terrae]SES42834.1 hypothetical protein SAMN04487818_113194 [Actinokineospora terrae]